MRDHVSILRPEIVSSGLSVCRVKTGKIVIGVHKNEQHILFELSDAEFEDFLQGCKELQIKQI
jgi:hypothetical protein